MLLMLLKTRLLLMLVKTIPLMLIRTMPMLQVMPPMCSKQNLHPQNLVDFLLLLSFYQTQDLLLQDPATTMKPWP